MFAFRDYKYTKKTGKATLCHNFYPNGGLFARFAGGGSGCGLRRFLVKLQIKVICYTLC